MADVDDVTWTEHAHVWHADVGGCDCQVYPHGTGWVVRVTAHDWVASYCGPRLATREEAQAVAVALAERWERGVRG